MNREEIVHFLGLLGITKDKVSDRDKWVASSCPLAPYTHTKGKDENPSFGVTLEQGEGRFHCYACGNYGTTGELLVELQYFMRGAIPGKVKLAEAYEFLSTRKVAEPANKEWEASKSVVKEIIPFPESWLESFKPYYASPRAMQYLKQRGVTPKVADECDVRYDSSKDRVCMPIRDRFGALAGMRGRAIDPNSTLRYYDYRYQEHSNVSLCWMGEETILYNKPLILCEGQFDVTAIREFYPNVVASLTASVSNDKMQRVTGARRLITFFDNDDAGKKLTLQFKSKLKGLEVDAITYPDDKYKDPNTVPKEVLHDLIKAAVSKK